MTKRNYDVINNESGTPIKTWTRGVPVEDAARQQLLNVASMPFIHKWVAAMPDVHWGMGATVGSVIPTVDAIIPAAVGVDIGCGMMAVQTTLAASDLPDNLRAVRTAIEKAVPHGRTHNGGRGDRGAWNDPPQPQQNAWKVLSETFDKITDKHPKVAKANNISHLGTLGTGNHFIEVCLDQANRVWFMLHSGSRGVGNRIGSYFIQLAKEEMRRWFINLPDANLSYLAQGSRYFDDYVEAVEWAQEYAMMNRQLMMEAVIAAVSSVPDLPTFKTDLMAVNCHHNYVARENHYGQQVYLTRKGAVRARKGDHGHHSRQHGRAFVHCPRQGQPGELP